MHWLISFYLFWQSTRRNQNCARKLKSHSFKEALSPLDNFFNGVIITLQRVILAFLDSHLTSVGTVIVQQG